MCTIEPMDMTIDQALDKIYGYVDYSMTHIKDMPERPFSLAKMYRLLERMDNPQKAYRVIHVAGTKGKGSVCAMLEAAFRSAGFKTGLYTSPHLLRFNERIMVNGKMIPDADIIDLTRQVTAIIDETEPVSSFDLMTAMAFEYFRREKVDIAIVEVGLGGRLDSTNVVDPILTAITSVSIDHTSFLGNTLAEIAAEKGGIIKPGVPLICGRQYPEAEAVLRKMTAEIGSPWIYVPERYRFINNSNCDTAQQMTIWKVEDQNLMETWLSENGLRDWEPTSYTVPFVGTHQMENAAVVYAVLRKYKSIDRMFDLDKALGGIANAFWPCRFEKISDRLYLDGAHNPDSMSKLVLLLERYCAPKRIKCILGVSEDKAIAEMVEILAPHVDEFIATRSTHPRAGDPDLIGRLCRRTGRKCVETRSLKEALELARRDDSPETCYIVTGSLFVTAGIRELLMKENPEIPYYEYWSVNE